jgi:hypothetical protein
LQPELSFPGIHQRKGRLSLLPGIEYLNAASLEVYDVAGGKSCAARSGNGGDLRIEPLHDRSDWSITEPLSVATSHRIS